MQEELPLPSPSSPWLCLVRGQIAREAAPFGSPINTIGASRFLGGPGVWISPIEVRPNKKKKMGPETPFRVLPGAGEYYSKFEK